MKETLPAWESTPSADLEREPEVKSFKTSMGSVYTRMPDGRYQRLKVANTPDRGLKEPEEFTLFISDAKNEVADAVYQGDVGEQEMNEKAFVVENMPGDQPIIRHKRSEVVNPDNLYVAIVRGMGTPQVKYTRRFAASFTPKPGKTVFEYTGADGGRMRTRHVGHEVTEIEYDVGAQTPETKPEPKKEALPASPQKVETKAPPAEAPKAAEAPRSTTFETPKGVSHARALLEYVSQLGDPKAPSFMDRFVQKNGAMMEDFLARVAMTLANRSKKKFEYRQKKIDSHIAKAKEAATKGWIRGAISGAFHEGWANWHKSKGANAYRSQEHWHNVRGTYEDRRNEVLEDLASQIDRPLETFKNRAEVITYLLEAVDMRVQESRKKLLSFYAELARNISPERRIEIPREIARISEEQRQDLEIMTNYEIRRGNIMAQANEQEQLKDGILRYTETPARPDTTPKEPAWLKRTEPRRRRAPSNEGKTT